VRFEIGGVGLIGNGGQTLLNDMEEAVSGSDADSESNVGILVSRRMASRSMESRSHVSEK
jgi:hypothetical protein